MFPPRQVSLSSVVMPMVKMVPRGFTAAADAYLTPHILRWVRGCRFMCWAGGAPAECRERRAWEEWPPRLPAHTLPEPSPQPPLLPALPAPRSYIQTFQAGFDEGLKQVPVYFMQVRVEVGGWVGCPGLDGAASAGGLRVGQAGTRLWRGLGDGRPAGRRLPDRQLEHSPWAPTPGCPALPLRAQSDGGLTGVADFSGHKAILSGPAGALLGLHWGGQAAC